MNTTGTLTGDLKRKRATEKALEPHVPLWARLGCSAVAFVLASGCLIVAMWATWATGSWAYETPIPQVFDGLAPGVWQWCISMLIGTATLAGFLWISEIALSTCIHFARWVESKFN